MSLPSPPLSVSLPAPPLKVSLPSPPAKLSLPAPPCKLSLPSPPSKVSAPSPPLNVFALASPYQMSSAEVPVVAAAPNTFISNNTARMGDAGANASIQLFKTAKPSYPTACSVAVANRFNSIKSTKAFFSSASLVLASNAPMADVSKVTPAAPTTKLILSK